MDNSINFKSEKYPLGAVYLPAIEKRGLSVGFYSHVIIPRIVLAQIVSWDGTEPILERYEDNMSFKTILYPAYYKFLECAANHPQIIEQDPYSFEHTKQDSPGTQPVTKGYNDYVDYIEILNLELTINQIKTCK